MCENLEGFEKEKRFMSHLTIGRVKSLGKQSKEQFLEKLNSIKIPEISFQVKEFCLMSSELKSSGVEYKVIEGFGLV
ncbi:MAG: 2'-5' RNA ligase family protein [Minisyncoccales bacterium]